MAYRMRRWTGLRPSRTSGRARPTMTDIAYCSQGNSDRVQVNQGEASPESGSNGACADAGRHDAVHAAPP